MASASFSILGRFSAEERKYLEGDKHLFELWTKAVSAKEWRTCNEIHTMVRICRAYTLDFGKNPLDGLTIDRMDVDDTNLKLEKGSATGTELCRWARGLFLALEFGWGALEETHYTMWGISEKSAKTAKEKGEESLRDYKERKAKSKERRAAKVVYQKDYSSGKTASGTGRTRQNSPCFSCGKMGHWAGECQSKG